MKSFKNLSYTVAIAALTIPRSNANDVTYCEDGCEIDLMQSCLSAVQNLEFFGSCCSLQEWEGNCKLVVRSGDCYFGQQGTGNCYERQIENPDYDGSLCGDYHIYKSTPHDDDDDDCPVSEFPIENTNTPSEGTNQQVDFGLSQYSNKAQDDDMTKSFNFNSTLTFQFLPGQDVLPYDEEISGVVEVTKQFFTDIIVTSIDAVGIYDSFQWFDMKSIQTHYLPPTSNNREPAVFYMNFLAEVAMGKGTSVTAETIVTFLRGADFVTYVYNYLPKSTPFNQNVFHDTQQVTFEVKV